MLCIVFYWHSEWEEKRQEWLLDEAASFAHKLLGSWRLDTRCTEAVIVLYSLRDGVVSGARTRRTWLSNINC